MDEIVTLEKAQELLDTGVNEAEALIREPKKVDDLLSQLEEKLKEVPAVGETLSDIPLMVSMVKGYITGSYKEVSPKVIVSIIGAFVYLVKKKDLIPDKIPVIGIVDDIAVLTLALKISEPELRTFKAWREDRGERAVETEVSGTEVSGTEASGEDNLGTGVSREEGTDMGNLFTKRKVDFRDYAGDIIKALPSGILLTTKADEKINSMVIGWGNPGINWGIPVFAVHVREGRFTREQLDMNPEFTINVPLGEYDKKIIGICGGKSGRDCDKIAEAGLTPVESENVSVPGIKEFPLTLECRIVYRQKQDLTLLPVNILERYYPQTVDSTNCGANKDAHVTYYGEIVGAYIIE